MYAIYLVKSWCPCDRGRVWPVKIGFAVWNRRRRRRRRRQSRYKNRNARYAPDPTVQRVRRKVGKKTSKIK